jgi:hypothetical protein
MKEVSFGEFCDQAGVLTPKQVKKLVPAKILKSLKPIISIEDDYMMAWEACSDSLALLKLVIKARPTLYIGTQIDGDDGGIFYENSCRIVNRNVYFLCSQNQEEELVANDED